MPLEKFQWATLHDLVSVSAHYGKVDTGMRVCQELCLIITLGKSTLIEGPPHPLLSRSTQAGACWWQTSVAVQFAVFGQKSSESGTDLH